MNVVSVLCYLNDVPVHHSQGIDQEPQISAIAIVTYWGWGFYTHPIKVHSAIVQIHRGQGTVPL